MRVRRALVVIPFLAACGGPLGEQGDDPVGVAAQADVCAAGAVLQGVDVSTYDGTVDWPTAKAHGISFAIAKATEGTSLQDDQFSTNWPAMKQNGVVRGAYHFFHCDDDPATQASFFLGVVGTLQPGDLPPVLDFEDSSCPASTAISLAVQWLDAVASATKTLPILYCSPGFIEGLDDPSALAGHAQLWVADWGPSCPELPAPFTTWPLWQYSATGTVPGVNGSPGMADLDEFNGDLTALMGITVGGTGSSSTSSSSGAGGAGGAPAGPPCTVNGVAGACIDTSLCATMPGYTSTPGFCPGPADEQCCTSTGMGGAGGSSSTSTTSATSTGAGASGATSTGTGTTGAGGGSPGPQHVSSSCSASPRGATGDAGLGARLIACCAALALATRARRRPRR
jgi:lysozyme